LGRWFRAQVDSAKEQRHDLVGEERSDDLSGQPRGEGILSDPLDKVTGKKKQQLISDQQDGERCREYAHAQQLAPGYLCGQRALECGVDGPILHRR
jgi:hypothetical protein